MKKKVFSLVRIKKAYLIIASAIVLPVILILGGFVAFFASYNGRMYPNVYINGIDVNRLTKQETKQRLIDSLAIPDTVKINIANPASNDSQIYPLPTNIFKPRFDYDSAATQAYTIGRQGNILSDAIDALQTAVYGKRFTTPLNADHDELYNQISIIASQIKNLPTPPSAFIENGEVKINKGENGYELDIELATNSVISAIEEGKNSVTLYPKQKQVSLNTTQVEIYKSTADKLLGKDLNLELDKQVVAKIDDGELISFIDPYSNTPNTEKVTDYLTKISNSVNRDPVNPVFEFKDNRVQEFKPAEDGIKLNADETTQKIVDGMNQLLSSDLDGVGVVLGVSRTAPEIQTQEVNDLGIKELIGVGTSSFRGSISSRVHNIKVAASKLNGVLIPPGEVFSFVNTLGDISTLTGYQQAYVIQGNETVLGDGGGVCQVSTTFFRAALDAGLPIIERHAHSYRVGYYEQGSPPGIDATIYYPTVDIKIKNDTPAHILIQTIADTKNYTLKFEFYGTSDGRVSTISKPVITESTPPPEDQYIDDPTLPAGQIKQIDYKAWGAKVNFNYTVTRNGEQLINKTFYSNYKPWQAKFLRGTGPAQ